MEEHDDAIGWKIAGIAIVQTGGAIFAIILHFLNSFNRMNWTTFWIILAVLVLLLALSIFVGMCSDPLVEIRHNFARVFWKMQFPAMQNKYRKNTLIRILNIFATADFIVAGICIINTGGSEKSVFAPFLFIILPVLLITRALRPWKLLLFFVVSLLIFIFGLCPFISRLLWRFAPIDFKPAGNVSHAVLLAISTTICFSFPFFIAYLDYKAELHQKNLTKANNEL